MSNQVNSLNKFNISNHDNVDIGVVKTAYPVEAKTKLIEQAKTDERSFTSVESKGKDWYIQIEDNKKATQIYYNDDLLTKLRSSIIDGLYEEDSKVVVHKKNNEGKWDLTKTTLFEFSKGYLELRILYQPVWSYAMSGLKWGALVGIILKVLDTLISLASVDPKLAFLFFASVAVVAIPRIGMVGVFAVIFISMKYTRINLFVMSLSAALIGALLGCLPGMAIGGIIGLINRNTIDTGKNLFNEPDGIVFKAVILPAIGAIALIYTYVFIFNPWALRILE